MSSQGVNSGDSNNPMNGYNAWQRALEQLEADVKNMLKQVNEEAKLLEKLNGEWTSKMNEGNKVKGELQKLQELIKILKELTGKVPQKLLDEEKSLEGQLSTIDSAISQLESQMEKVQTQLDANQATLAKDRKKLTNFEGQSAANASQNQQMEKTLKQTDQQVRSQQQKKQNAAAERKAALAAIEAEIGLELALAQDAIYRIGKITGDKEQIAKDKAEITELKHEITEDGIKLGAACAWAAACWGLNPAADAAVAYYSYEINKLRNELSNVETNLHKTQKDLAVQEKDLKADMDKLETLSVKGLDSLINSLFKEISKLVDLFGKGGKASEGTMQKASEIIAEVMAIVEMITAKVHQMRSQDQQWMSRASAANSEVQAVKSKINVQSLEALEKYAQFMKMVMTAVQVVADVAAVAIAVATGGTCAIVMAMIMVALSASGLMEKATDALAKSMHKLGASAKAVADVIMGVISMIATMGTSAIAEGIGQAVAEVAEEVEEEVSEMIEMDVMNVLQNGLGKIASSIEQAGSELADNLEEAGEEVEQVAKTAFEKFTEAMTKFKNGFLTAMSKSFDAAKENFTNVKGMLGQTTAYWGSAGGLTDAAQAIYADSTHQAGVAYNKVKMAEWMKILQIVLAVVQAVIEMAACYYGGGANSDETSVMERIFGKMTKMSFVTNAAVSTELVAQGVGTVAQANLMVNSLAKSELTKKMGENQAELAYIKATGEQRKIFEKKQLELFASQMEQQIAALYTQVKKNGEAEREAAMVLQQSAV